MRMNDVFTCLNERWNENQSGRPHLKLKMIIRVSIPTKEVRMRILFPTKATILPLLKL